MHIPGWLFIYLKIIYILWKIIKHILTIYHQMILSIKKSPQLLSCFFFRNPDKNCPQKFFSPKIHPPQLASPQIRARSFRKVHTLRVRWEIPPSKPESSLVVLPSHLKIWKSNWIRDRSINKQYLKPPPIVNVWPICTYMNGIWMVDFFTVNVGKYTIHIEY